MDFSLTAGQYDLIFNLLSLTVAAMFAAGIYFFASRQHVAEKYRPALLVSALVVWIAGYHYWRIQGSWEGAFALQDGAYVPTEKGFNDAYRYADWLITVPLLLVELVAVLGLRREKARGLFTKLVIASTLMIGLGYPGEVAADAGAKWLWWGASMIPFLYIMGVLFGQLGQTLSQESGRVRGLVSLARTVLVATWIFYPVAFAAPMLGLSGPVAEVALQVGYTIADITAKAGFGLVIYAIARAKTAADAEGAQPLTAKVAA